MLIRLGQTSDWLCELFRNEAPLLSLHGDKHHQIKIIFYNTEGKKMNFSLDEAF